MKVGVIPQQVLVVPVVVAVVVAGAVLVVPVLLVVGAVPVAAIGATALKMLLVLHGGFPQMQMVQIQIQPDGGELLPVDGKVQLRKLILVVIGSYFTLH